MYFFCDKQNYQKVKILQNKNTVNVINESVVNVVKIIHFYNLDKRGMQEDK